MDSQRRENNVVIMGGPDGATSLAGKTDDIAKCKHILDTIGASDVVIDVKRLGTHIDGRVRPLLVKTPCKEARDVILANAKKLKEAGDAYYRHTT